MHKTPVQKVFHEENFGIRPPLTLPLKSCANNGRYRSVALAADHDFPPVPPCPGPGDANSEEPTANSELGSLQQSPFEIKGSGTGS